MTMRHRTAYLAAGAALAIMVTAPAASAQITQRTGVPPALASKVPQSAPDAGVALPNYIIGPDDVLSVQVWREPDVSGDVTVRPDGKITLQLGDDIVAAGLTTDQLKEKVAAELKRFIDEPTVFIQVKQINSRRVFITGMVMKPGPYPLTSPLTVVQLIATAGGLLEYADRKHVVLISGTEKDKNGQPVTLTINYDDLRKGKNVAKYNVLLQPGDTIIVR